MPTSRDLRAFLRPLIPRIAYKAAANIADRWAVQRQEGFEFYRELTTLDGSDVSLPLRSLRHPLLLRRCESHVGALIQNVFRGEYDRFQHQGFRAEVVIDAGAFIGDLTCHWATLFPHARIYALEPNRENFRYAETNVAGYGAQVTLLRAGLWSHSCRLKVIGTEMGATVREVQGADFDVDAIDIPYLLNTYGLNRIDILKLDIEGAEAEVLGQSCLAWIHLVKVLIAEFHDPSAEAEISRRLVGVGFNARRHRSLVYFERA